MTILGEEGLQAELRRAMKDRATVEVSVLRGLLAVIKNAGIERRTGGKGALEDADLVQIVRREIKQRDEAAEFARQAGRADLVEKNRVERAILERYLPPALGRDELEAAVKHHHEEGATAIGPIMAKLKEQFGTRLDGRMASEVIRALVQEKGGS